MPSTRIIDWRDRGEQYFERARAATSPDTATSYAALAIYCELRYGLDRIKNAADRGAEATMRTLYR